MVNEVLRLNQVKARTGLSRSTIYAKLASQEFPRPIRLGLRSVGWIASEVDAWIQERCDDRNTAFPTRTRFGALRHVTEILPVIADDLASNARRGKTATR